MKSKLVNFKDCLPCRVDPLDKKVLLSLEQIFENSEQHLLDQVILVETKSGLLTWDGNHRLVLTLKYKCKLKSYILVDDKTYFIPNVGKIRVDWKFIWNLNYYRQVSIEKGFATFEDLYKNAYANSSLQ